MQVLPDRAHPCFPAIIGHGRLNGMPWAHGRVNMAAEGGAAEAGGKPLSGRDPATKV